MVFSVHYLRGLAAVIVVCFHYRYYINDSFSNINLGDFLFSNGAYGVDLFFIISGFIICYSTRRPEKLPALSFGLKRFFRIYPLLFASLILFGRGRDTGFPMPPAQIRTCRITAYGSYLGYNA